MVSGHALVDMRMSDHMILMISGCYRACDRVVYLATHNHVPLSMVADKACYHAWNHVITHWGHPLMVDSAEA